MENGPRANHITGPVCRRLAALRGTTARTCMRIQEQARRWRRQELQRQRRSRPEATSKAWARAQFRAQAQARSEAIYRPKARTRHTAAELVSGPRGPERTRVVGGEGVVGAVCMIR